MLSRLGRKQKMWPVIKRCSGAVFPVLVAVALRMCGEQALASGSGRADAPCLCLKKVVDGLYNPVEYLTVRRDNSLLILVVEQRGVVRAFVKDKRERKEFFMDLRDRVTTTRSQGEERGECLVKGGGVSVF